jgi:hypothetical protein
MEQIQVSGAQTMVVPCHSCHGQFNNIKEIYGLKDLKIAYLWERVADCMIVQ